MIEYAEHQGAPIMCAHLGCSADADPDHWWVGPEETRRLCLDHAATWLEQTVDAWEETRELLTDAERERDELREEVAYLREVLFGVARVGCDAERERDELREEVAYLREVLFGLPADLRHPEPAWPVEKFTGTAVAAYLILGGVVALALGLSIWAGLSSG